jgi:rhodanese-related sulfurtransferase
MTTTQIVLYLIIAVTVIAWVRRFLLARGVQQYSPREIAERLKVGGTVVLLDVRTAAERRSGHIRGSIHIPLDELRGRIGELTRYRSSEVICYCQSGNRSVTAAALLRKNGFAAGNLKGGIAEWNFSGLK